MALRAVKLDCGTDARQLEEKAAGLHGEQRCQDRPAATSTLSTPPHLPVAGTHGLGMTPIFQHTAQLQKDRAQFVGRQAGQGARARVLHATDCALPPSRGWL